ncbi:Crotonobetainyl-CoA:carnitine CoA-transferase CaiB [Microbulbifer donghaiensis]|uniref:Crotonobetainyl-CoA:carnitine CoA-transferase CaiB n=1 Tax=Microbulbifer donghaiensis TaxID=494016 RepID=A0A1M5FQ24_9GAMM|nr:CaiB/BaiF CoA-transferase family protein [Microbulbifer donghaiensis]SHF93647.1 Crotonobetainyl-CoA:carnitine CoA-transferase CaiB [Microbulbifer donghaiensis]
MTTTNTHENNQHMQNINGPLKGLKILDFSTLLPGPYATMLLADMGAEVLRIESPTRPDMLRGLPPMVGGEHPVSAVHATINRNKQALALDLKDPRAKEIVRRLLVEYDIIVEQFRPGVMDRLGLSYHALRETRKDLIYCSITGYGQTGPLKQRAGHDINYLALSGLASYSGREQSGPSLSGTQVADIAGGSHHAVMGILAAVYQRQQSGRGSHIDISMTDCAFALNAVSGANALAGAGDPMPEQELLNGGSYYDYYRTADNRYLSVGSLEPQFAEQFFTAIGHPEWLQRVLEPDQQQLKQDIAAAIAMAKLDDWMRVFEACDACIEPVLNFSEATESVLIKERQMLCEAVLANGDIQQQINTPLTFDGHKPRRHTAGAPLGQHTHELLNELGYTQEEIEQMQAQGVVA